MSHSVVFVESSSLHHQMSNKDIKEFFKSSENVQKKEGGPDRPVSNTKFSSVTLNNFVVINLFTAIVYWRARGHHTNRTTAETEDQYGPVEH